MIKQISYPTGGARVVIKNDKEFQQMHWLGGCFYEARRGGILNYLFAQVPKGGKWIDIGASLGNHTMFFKAIMKADEVHAVEPFKSSYEHLIENVTLNEFKDVYTYNMALGEKNGLCSMTNINEQQVGMTEVSEGNDTELRTIDSLDFFEGYDVIKIDVEHYNEQLLKGAKETFTKGKGLIFIEAESEEERDLTDSYMKSYGYRRVPDLVMNSTPTYLYVK